MYRRVLSLLLLPCIVLTQSAVLSHSHGGSRPAGHDLRPHFHTGLSADPHHHEHGHHHHGHGGHHHHHHEDGDGSPEPDSPPTPAPEPLSGHDSDAVFVGLVDAVLNVRSADDQPAASALWFSLGFNLSFPSVNSSQEAIHWTRPPPTSASDCPLYVRHLTLLI
jgi:hypothetical protein